MDVSSGALRASLYSSAADGGKGGDIYFLSVCGSDALTRVALADVVGHGRTVADVSQWLYESLEARMGSLDGNRILSDLNQLTVDRGVSALTTGTVASFYSWNSNIYFSYAGHHPMLIHHDGASCWEAAEIAAGRLDTANIPLGVLPDATYDQQAITAQRGDRLFLYTDGLVEAVNDEDEPFGERRLRAVLDDYASAGLGALKQAVIDAARDFTRGTPAHDDITLIAVEIQ
jgi:sigma-B regulation protein RsbU (phosphoserine phosphatase)